MSDAEKSAILEERIRPDRAVLLVVDMQNDFVSPEGKMAQFGFEIGSVRETITPIRKVLNAARSLGYQRRSRPSVDTAVPGTPQVNHSGAM